MASIYRFTMKSEEQEGAGQSNNVYIQLASDADAILFAQNLELAFQADVVSVDKVLSRNYATPYPAGTNKEFRYAMRDSLGHVQTERLYEVTSSATTDAFAAAITGATGISLYSAGQPIVSVQTYAFELTNSF